MGYLSELATRPIEWSEALKIMKANEDDKQLHCLLCLGFYTAMRRSEMLELTFAQAYNKTHISFVAKGGRIRKVKLHRKLIDSISAWYEEYSKKMYFNPDMKLIHTNDNKYGRFNKMHPFSLKKMLLEAIGKTDVKVYKVSAHFLRKTFAKAIWDKMGGTEKALVTVSGLLGHKDYASTMHYLGLEDMIFDKIYDIL